MIFTELLRQSRNVKNKREKLNGLLRDRGIPGIIRYINQRHFVGWFIYHPGGPQRIGQNYIQARDLIQAGVLDHLKG